MKDRPIVPLILVIVAFLLASRLSPHFLDGRYLLDTSTLYVETGLLALAMTLVIVSGNIDLSVGSILVLTACLAAKMFERGYGPAFVIPAACLIGTMLGAFNGLLVAKLRLPAFLVTLGTMALFRGIAQAMLGPKSVALPDSIVGLDQALILGLPWPLVILLLIGAVFWISLHKTVFGRWIFALGTNERAALYAGLPIDRIKISVFAISGLLAGIAALLIDSRLGVARHDLAKGIELDAITVAVVGGAAIQGGKGSILGSILALFLILILKTAMGVSNVKAEYQLTAIGALLIIAALVQRIDLNRFRKSNSPPPLAPPPSDSFVAG